MAGKKIKQKELSHFLIDALYGMRIIGELDGAVGEEMRVELEEYQFYELGGKDLCRYVDYLYSVYLKEKVAGR